MKVRVNHTVECTDEWRRAIRRFYGKDGLATRAECKRWLEARTTIYVRSAWRDTGE